MSGKLDRLITTLEKDKALFFDSEQVIIPKMGWAYKYANALQCIIDSDLEVFRSPNIKIDNDDIIDLTRLAQRSGYIVTFNNNSILFEAEWP